MDDPMVRLRLGRTSGTRLLGALDPKQEPPILSLAKSRRSHPNRVLTLDGDPLNLEAGAE
jgi:hypothetical protein